ncbi:hypothetical protein AJ80_08488 [Polytolypa hystricis UAMH7299]|uniref:AB hydrolase-1 domain-containing protein n=1 Tax=Polytolypa hystricis (strain UAMH7299) TaxID=1447883 RepID=A0A2B7WZ87_POLH7|nr:hypothetical protein AJ80_08488 [Polytolypa hystricis UAMH7299]
MATIANLVSKRLHYVPGRLAVTELFFDVPVDHSRPDGASLRLFGRSVRRREYPSVDPEKEDKPTPYLVYLQGGPGSGCSPPQELSWVGTMLDKGYQVLLLDQRGTGQSSPITAATLNLQGNAIKQAEYLRMFRADSIVRDCEAVRYCLTAAYPTDKKEWSILGQSFGGFCAVTYLSKFPEGLREVFITGGLPPLVKGPDPIYMRTYEKVLERNEAFYNKFPEDGPKVNRIVKNLREREVRLPGGGVLTPARFQQLGLGFGMKGGIDYVHELILRADTDLEIFGFLTTPTLARLGSATTMDNTILYAVLHESIYCQGQASNWSADRLISKFDHFHNEGNESGQFFFTGEMIYRHMFTSSPELIQVKEAADIVATYDDWPDLYDEEQLAKNEVPVYAATFIDDMYVHYQLATETAQKIKGCKQFITNTMYHNAIRADSEAVMKQLFALRDDTID